VISEIGSEIARFLAMSRRWSPAPPLAIRSLAPIRRDRPCCPAIVRYDFRSACFLILSVPILW
jgi:hypothetical protein